MDSRVRSGTRLLEMFWYITADRIVNKAIAFYKLDDERAEALRRVYLRPGDYTVSVKKTN
jgi:hypothetical protein